MKSRATGSIIIGLIASVGILVLTVFPVVAVEAVYPVERARLSLLSRIRSSLRGAWRGMAAERENARLRRELSVLSMIRSDEDRLLAENERLRRQLGLREATPGVWMSADVLSSGGGAAGRLGLLRVNRGSLEGVSVGAVVAVPDGLVGRVVSVTPHTATVVSLTDPTEQVHCQVEGSREVRGLLSGGTESCLVLKSLQGTFSGVAPVSVRARVLTSGLGGAFPPGLEIGTWIQFSTNANGVVTGEVLPAVEFSTLEEVLIRREK